MIAHSAANASSELVIGELFNAVSSDHYLCATNCQAIKRLDEETITWRKQGKNKKLKFQRTLFEI